MVEDANLPGIGEFEPLTNLTILLPTAGSLDDLRHLFEPIPDPIRTWQDFGLGLSIDLINTKTNDTHLILGV